MCQRHLQVLTNTTALSFTGFLSLAHRYFQVPCSLFSFIKNATIQYIPPFFLLKIKDQRSHRRVSSPPCVTHLPSNMCTHTKGLLATVGCERCSPSHVTCCLVLSLDRTTPVEVKSCLSCHLLSGALVYLPFSWPRWDMLPTPLPAF